MPPKPTKLSWTLAILAILLALALLILAQSTHPIVPSEDAYITFRYARNLAEGHGLVWNPGEDPVEGSTEFLWVMLVAGGSKLGPGVETVAWGLNILFAVLGTILVGLAAFHLSRRQALVVLLAAVDDDIGALLGQAHGDAAADALSAAGDQGDLIVQAHCRPPLALTRALPSRLAMQMRRGQAPECSPLLIDRTVRRAGSLC